MNLPTPHARIAALQERLHQQEVAAWIVPSADPHQSEYVAEHWQDRAWLSGFSGSADSTTDFGDFYRFETLGLCPFDLALVDSGRLDENERGWLNGYHQSVYASLAPLLEPAECAWLQKATRAI